MNYRQWLYANLDGWSQDMLPVCTYSLCCFCALKADETMIVGEDFY